MPGWGGRLTALPSSPDTVDEFLGIGEGKEWKEMEEGKKRGKAEKEERGG